MAFSRLKELFFKNEGFLIYERRIPHLRTKDSSFKNEGVLLQVLQISFLRLKEFIFRKKDIQSPEGSHISKLSKGLRQSINGFIT